MDVALHCGALRVHLCIATLLTSPRISWISAVEWGVMLAAVVSGLFSPAGLPQNTTGGVRAGAVQHSRSQAAAGNLKQLWKVCCVCAHCDLKCFINLTAWLPLTGGGETLWSCPLPNCNCLLQTLPQLKPVFK